MTLSPRSRTKPNPYHLICVAHPDDETIFFGGLIQRLAKNLDKSQTKTRRGIKIICATDANADGHGRKRKLQFQRACRELGVTDTEWWGFPDIYEKRLPVGLIVEKLRELPVPQDVYTHGIVGEYGHPHHQDISYAVHRAFAPGSHATRKVYSVAYNSFPDRIITLTPDEYAHKAQILTRTYGSETQRFLSLLPATFCEGYQQLSLEEVEALYGFFARGEPLKKTRLKRYAWLNSYLKQNRERARPF